MIQVLTPESWEDYALLDSGEGEKLERWGQYVVARPEPRAIWKKNDQPAWMKADAYYAGEDWRFRNSPPKPWIIQYKKQMFSLRPTDFKHTGVFPEQAVNWDWLGQTVGGKPLKVLNLFAYTGGATMAAAGAGAHVTHVDASKPAMMWASENAKLSGIAKEAVRWIQDDAQKFVNREVRRGVQYEGIIMDPPRFGRGAGGELWKLEENLPELIFTCRQLLSDKAEFFLVNAYTADLSSLAIGNLICSALGREVEQGELGIREQNSGRIMPAGVWARWSRTM